MKRALVIPESLQEMIRHLPPELKRRVRRALEEIAKDSESGKLLTEELQGLRSYKLGQLRIIYKEKSSLIEIVNVGPRKTIYQKVALEIKRKGE